MEEKFLPPGVKPEELTAAFTSRSVDLLSQILGCLSVILLVLIAILVVLVVKL